MTHVPDRCACRPTGQADCLKGLGAFRAIKQGEPPPLSAFDSSDEDAAPHSLQAPGAQNSQSRAAPYEDLMAAVPASPDEEQPVSLDEMSDEDPVYGGVPSNPTLDRDTGELPCAMCLCMIMRWLTQA